MIKHFLKIAFRNRWRHRIFSLINIVGLAVGMTACLFIFLYVRVEENHDSFAAGANRILVGTGILATLIVLFAICFWTIKSTLTNRVRSLRTD